MKKIIAILKTPIQKLEKSIFSFRRTNEVAVRNSKIFTAFTGDLDISIAAQKYRTLHYISEFSNTAALTKLFYYNEDRVKIINIIQQGSSYYQYPIEEETWKSYLDAMILRGNHKSYHSEMNSTTLYKSIIKEIDHVCALPLTIECLQNIKM